MGKSKRNSRGIEYTAGWHDYASKKICFAYWSDGERMQREFDFDWYFFLRKIDAEKVACRTLDGMTDSIEEHGDFVKLFVPFYDEKRKDLIEWLQAQGVEPLEADVHPLDRFMFDTEEIVISSEPKILFYDIETDSSKGGWEHIEDHRILSIAYAGRRGEVKCLIAKTADSKGEKELIEKFLDIAANHDTLIAWNGEAYDEVVLRERAKLYKIYPNWNAINFLDMLQLFKKYYMRDGEGSGVRISFSLENISQTVLGSGKLEDMPKHRLIDVWRKDKDKLIAYNKRDVQIMQELEEKLRYVEAQTMLAQLCNRFLSDRALRSAFLVDGFVLKYAAEKNKVHFKTKVQRESYDDEKPIEGAFVMDPTRGLHLGICDLDFSSLYPSIVISWNISPETKLNIPQDELERADGFGADIGGARAANGAIFKQGESGVFPAISAKALFARQSWKSKAKELEEIGQEGSMEHRIAQQRSDAWKVLANSMYGVLSSPFSRYYDTECGEAITVTGKTIIQKVIELAKAKGLEVVYGDTDSIFLKCTKAIAEEFSAIAVEHVKEFVVSMGATPGLIKLKLDAEFVRLFFTAKKRYAGKKTSGKWDVRGLELIRSDGCKYSRELQRRLIEFVLEADRPSVKMAKFLTEKWAHRLFSGGATVDELFLAQTLSRSVDNYKVDTLHVRIAKELMAKGREVYVGMKIPYIVTGKKNGRLEAVHKDEYTGHYDARLYWRSKVYPPTRAVLESVFPDAMDEWARLDDYEIGGPRQPTLFDKKSKVNYVDLGFHESDSEKFEEVRSILDKHPGEHPIRLVLQLKEAEATLMSECRVRFVPELVIELEKAVGHKVYYGKEDWDQ